MKNIIFQDKQITPFALGALKEIEKIDPGLSKIIEHCDIKDSGIYHYSYNNIKVISIFKSKSNYEITGGRFKTDHTFELQDDEVYVQGAWQNNEGQSCPCIDTLINLINDIYKDVFQAERRDGVCYLYNNQSNSEENPSFHLQTIYYGAPGTGKSFQVKGKVKEITGSDDNDFVFRTTFHPDYDYASFVGCLKPITENDKIKYKFQPQVFINAYVKAWKNSNKNVLLIIEELNRGNCAQIFGDIFQLLDRTDGVSEYPIEVDSDVTKYLIEELGAEHEGIKNSKIKLPGNLSILATMNTSDQSLFPIDSAFKRRWDWEYVAINYKNEKSKDFEIKINDSTSYKWVKFLEKVNARILDVTKSEDKQMGDFFIRSSVDCNTFINKVMFYLWNDICKENYGTFDNIFRKRDNVQSAEKQDSNDTEFSFSELIAKKEDTLIKFMNSLGIEKETI